MSVDETTLEKICGAFLVGEASWKRPECGGATSSVIYYLTAIRTIAEKPFADEDIHFSVMQFLEKKVDESSNKLVAETMARIRDILNPPEEVQIPDEIELPE